MIIALEEQSLPELHDFVCTAILTTLPSFSLKDSALLGLRLLYLSSRVEPMGNSSVHAYSKI